MRQRLAVLVIVCVATGLALAGELSGTTYGDGVHLTEPVPIARLLSQPDGYVGQRIRVDGVITGVCKKRGCWMQLTDPDTGQGIRVKVEDGVIVFPYESMGHHAAAEGVLEAIKLTPEQVAARAEAAGQAAGHAHAPGEPCDSQGSPASKAGCDAPVQQDTIYVLRGTGAVIQS